MHYFSEQSPSAFMGKELISERTSENAGATIFRNFFQSSPSEATMFIPKTDNALYRFVGLGNLAREVVTSYLSSVGGRPEGRSLTQSEVETYFDGSCVCKAYNAVRPRKRTNLQVCFLLSLCPFRSVTQGITREIASCPAAANSIVWKCTLDSVRLYGCHRSVPSYFLSSIHFVPIFR